MYIQTIVKDMFLEPVPIILHTLLVVWVVVFVVVVELMVVVVVKKFDLTSLLVGRSSQSRNS